MSQLPLLYKFLISRSCEKQAGNPLKKQKKRSKNERVPKQRSTKKNPFYFRKYIPTTTTTSTNPVSLIHSGSGNPLTHAHSFYSIHPLPLLSCTFPTPTHSLFFSHIPSYPLSLTTLSPPFPLQRCTQSSPQPSSPSSSHTPPTPSSPSQTRISTASRPVNLLRLRGKVMGLYAFSLSFPSPFLPAYASISHN